MIINVKLLAGLQELLPDGIDTYPIKVPPEATVEEVMGKIKLPPEKPLILLVNGKHTGRDHSLKEGDRLSLFPPIARG